MHQNLTNVVLAVGNADFKADIQDYQSHKVSGGRGGEEREGRGEQRRERREDDVGRGLE